MKKLWQKTWNLNKDVEAFETKEDLAMDQLLIPYDVYGTLAHGKMLFSIGILSQKEYNDLLSGMKDILSLYEKGEFVLQLGDEDVHTKIENYLTERFGGIGKKIHTGRSRNDQSLTMLRLFLKEQIITSILESVALSEVFLSFAKQFQDLFMPGYTHMQKAMPMSVGMWAGSFVESLLDDLSFLEVAFSTCDQSPLGSGAGFGLPIDTKRQCTSSHLGFSRVQENPLYCQNSRGKLEASVLSAYISLLMTLNKFATDILLFTTSEFGFFSVSEEILSGSSIMPQKKNLDLAELIRSKVHRVIGNYTAIVGIASNLPSGYNRDLQDTKKHIVESCFVTNETIHATTILLSAIRPKNEFMKKAMTDDLFVTHHAFSLVEKGMPFREAYLQAAEDFLDGKQLSEDLKTSSWKLTVNNLAKKISTYKNVYQKQKMLFEKTLEHLFGEGR